MPYLNAYKVVIGMFKSVREKKMKKIQMTMIQEAYKFKRLVGKGVIKEDAGDFLRFIRDARDFGMLDEDYTDLQKEVYDRFSYNIKGI